LASYVAFALVILGAIGIQEQLDIAYTDARHLHYYMHI